MSFGFSVGDFIAALELVGTVVASLRESGGAKSQFRELLQELYTLETALLKVKQLDFEEEQRAEFIALTQAACRCQVTITEFWKRTKKWQKHLGPGGESSTFPAAWMKVRWALFKSEEVARFKADIAAHSQSILVLLAAMQMQRLDLQHQANKASFAGLRDMFQQTIENCYQKLEQISTAVGGTFVQGQKMLHRTAMIFRTNIQIFQVVCAIQTRLDDLPPQIERQQPVYMIDALGKVSPFHLEFVRSAEAFRAVLKSNFQKVPSGLRKIHNGEFIIHDAANGRPIDLTRDWDTCFMPGQRIDMRMVFRWHSRRRDACPSCGFRGERNKELQDSECKSCGLTFHRLVQTVKDSEAFPTQSGTGAEPSKALVQHHAMILADTTADEAVRLAPTTAFDESDDVKYYRRVRMVQWKRHRAWETPTPGAQRAQRDRTGDVIEELTQQEDDNESTKDEQDRDEERDNAVAYFGEDVDFSTFEQILEMDDDIEREFSREVILGSLETCRITFNNIKDYIEMPELDVGRITGTAHYLKGVSNSMGLTKCYECAIEIQAAKYYCEGFTDEETRVWLRKQCDVYEPLLEEARRKLFAFYKVDTV
ncbi:Multistep phosphorelay regulator 1 [Pseudocercospora fuligena]|uniref:Multistep phosphorelay regulator 1 n=1 Tax=Pseudocercospora fuligena TaxID=685502 RepID=A0A8H6RGM4_9PEZI|nr:Multistep phosphorelay regulator 1 [Pseudocercospora fuligena]